MLGGHRGLKAKLRVLRESSSGCWLRLKNAYKLQFVNKLPGGIRKALETLPLEE